MFLRTLHPRILGNRLHLTNIHTKSTAPPTSKNGSSEKEEKEKPKRGLFGFGKSGSGAKKDAKVLRAADAPEKAPLSNAKDAGPKAVLAGGKPTGDLKLKDGETNAVPPDRKPEGDLEVKNGELKAVRPSGELKFENGEAKVALDDGKRESDLKTKDVKDSPKRDDGDISETGKLKPQSKDERKALVLEQREEMPKTGQLDPDPKVEQKTLVPEQSGEALAEGNGHVGATYKMNNLVDDLPLVKRPAARERHPVSEPVAHAGNGTIGQEELNRDTDNRFGPLNTRGGGDVRIQDSKHPPPSKPTLNNDIQTSAPSATDSQKQSSPTSTIPSQIQPTPTGPTSSHNPSHPTAAETRHPAHASPPPDLTTNNRSLTTQERRPGLKKVYFDPRTKEFFMSSHDLHAIVSGSPFTSDSESPSRRSHTRSSSSHSRSAPRNTHKSDLETAETINKSTPPSIPPTSRRHKRTTTEPVPIPSSKILQRNSSPPSQQTSSHHAALRRLRSLDLSQSETDLGAEFIHPAIVKKVEREEPFPSKSDKSSRKRTVREEDDDEIDELEENGLMGFDSLEWDVDEDEDEDDDEGNGELMGKGKGKKKGDTVKAKTAEAKPRTARHHAEKYFVEVVQPLDGGSWNLLHAASLDVHD